MAICSNNQTQYRPYVVTKMRVKGTDVKYYPIANIRKSLSEYGGPSGILKSDQIIYKISKYGNWYRFSFNPDGRGELYYVQSAHVELLE